MFYFKNIILSQTKLIDCNYVLFHNHFSIITVLYYHLPDLRYEPAAYMDGIAGFTAIQEIIPAWPSFTKSIYIYTYTHI